MGLLLKLVNSSAFKWLLKWLLKPWPKAYCKFYGHDLRVSIDKPKLDPTVHHTLYCNKCLAVFSFHNVSYKVYSVNGVNPQYFSGIKEWLQESGVEGDNLDKLITNLQKFRNRATRPDIVTRNKGKKDVHRTTSTKESLPGILRT